MSRRHKTKEELERIHPPKRESQGDCSQIVASDTNQIIFRVFTSPILGSHISMLDKLMGNTFDYSHLINKLIEAAARHPDYASGIIESAISEFQRLDNEALEKQPIKRGRRTVMQLLNNYDNKQVCKWYDRICSKLKMWISSLKQMLCCFFCALFDIVKSESANLKEACYYRVMKDHIKEKIPSMSSIQKGIKWLRGWRKEVLPWADKLKEARLHRLWDDLRQRIVGELLLLEPQLAM